MSAYEVTAGRRLCDRLVSFVLAAYARAKSSLLYLACVPSVLALSCMAACCMCLCGYYELGELSFNMLQHKLSITLSPSIDPTDRPISDISQMALSAASVGLRQRKTNRVGSATSERSAITTGWLRRQNTIRGRRTNSTCIANDTPLSPVNVITCRLSRQDKSSSAGECLRGESPHDQMLAIPWRRLFLAAYTLCAKPGCCCCPAWQSVCRVIAVLHGRLLYVVSCVRLSGLP